MSTLSRVEKLFLASGRFERVISALGEEHQMTVKDLEVLYEL